MIQTQRRGTFTDYRLVIYGDGPEREDILSYIKLRNLSDSVDLFHNCSDVHEKIIKSSMFVSSSNYEGLSNSMLEAMAIGLPTICTDCPCGGARMVIKNNINGLLVPTGDKDSLAVAMEKIAKNQQLSQKLSNNSKKLRDMLSLDKIAKQWESLFERESNED